MHLSQVWIGLPSLARQDLSAVHAVLPSTASVAGGSFMRDIWELADLMALAVNNDPERDPRVLADRIEARALTYHLLNETLLHGYDIARAAGRPWRIDPAYAAMALGQFIVPILRMTDPRVFVNQAKAAGVRAT